MIVQYFNDYDAKHRATESILMIFKALIERKDWCMVFQPEGNYVITGANAEFNEDYCVEHNIPIFRTINSGGSIVTAPGDVTIAHVSTNIRNTYTQDCTERVVQHLRNKGLNVETVGNDVIVDGKYKVFSTSTKRFFGYMLYSSAHCCIGCDLELIQNICTKPMEKIPRGLADYGITTEEMLALLTEETNESK